MATLQLQIVTPQQEVVRTEALSVSVNGELGRMQILPGHTNLISLVKPGRIVYTTASGQKTLQAGAGHIEVIRQQVTLSVNSAELVAAQE